MLVFDCPDETMVDRIVKRGETSGRADDTAETAWARIKTFREQSAAPLKFFHAKGTPFIKIDATRPLDVNVDYIMEQPLFKNLSRH